MRPSMKRGHSVFFVVALTVLTVLLLGLLAPFVPHAQAETASRATGAKSVGSTYGQVNYYANGYPPKPNVLYTFNLSDSFQWNLTVQEMLDHISTIKDFNSALYDGTDGQMAVEKIDLWNDMAHWDVADFQFLSSSGRSYTERGGIDSGGHIELYTNYAWGKVQQHEFGHYGLYLPDEYTDAHGAFCDCTQGTCYNTNEWCSKSTHCKYDWSFCHDQGNGEALSCWEQMGVHYPHLAVKDPPVAGPYDAPTPLFVWHDKYDFATKDANMSIWPAKPSLGDTIDVNVTFTNYNYSIDGNQRFDLFDKDPKAGGKLLQSQTVDVRDLPSFTVPFTISGNAGMNTFYAVADTNNSIHEFNETNNVAKGQVYVNHRPTIDPALQMFTGYEDQPLTVNLMKYGHDFEDTNASLVWNITSYDTKKIVDLKQDLTKDLFTFTPVRYWHGTTTVNVTLTDTAGASTKGAFVLNYQFVNHRPTVTSLTIDTRDALRGGSANLVMRGQDIEDKENFLVPDMEFKVPGGDWTILQVSWKDGTGFVATLDTTMLSVLGNYSIKGSFTDSNDGASGWTYLNDTFLVRNNPPQILSVLPSQETLFRTETATVGLTAQDIENSPEKLSWEVMVEDPEGTWTNFTGPIEFVGGHWQITFAPDAKAILGNYNFRARAKDLDGNYTDWLDSTDGMIVQNNVPIAQYIKVDGNEIYRTKTIQVRAAGKDVEQGGSGLKADLEYSYGSTWATDLLSKPYYDSAKGEWVANFTPGAGADLGAVSFHAVFTDADGDSSQYVKSDQVQVRNSPPECWMDGPQKGQTGDKLQFHGSNSTDVEGPVTYDWSFGDGTTSVSADPVHQYTNARTYLVTLTVKDLNGVTASRSINLTITKKPAPPTPFTNPTNSSGSNFTLWLLVLLVIIVVVCLVAVGVYVSRRNKRRAAAMPPPVAVAPASPSLVYAGLESPAAPKPPAPAETPKQAPPVAPGPPKEPVKEAPKEPTKETPKEEPKVEQKPPPGPPPPGPLQP